MAKLHTKNDGGFYITKGYSLTKRGVEDSHFVTYTVHPRGEDFLRLAAFKDGETVPKDIFYSLILDGDISTPKMERKPLDIGDLPMNAQLTLSLIDDDPKMSEIGKLMVNRKMICLRDIFRFLQENKWTRAQALRNAATLCLYQHYRHYMARPY